MTNALFIMIRNRDFNHSNNIIRTNYYLWPKQKSYADGNLDHCL